MSAHAHGVIFRMLPVCSTVQIQFRLRRDCSRSPVGPRAIESDRVAVPVTFSSGYVLVSILQGHQRADARAPVELRRRTETRRFEA